MKKKKKCIRMIGYLECKKMHRYVSTKNIKICLSISINLLIRKLLACMFLSVQHFKPHSNSRVSFKLGMCVSYWILSQQYSRVFYWSLLSQIFFVCHKQHFCPLGKREENSLVVMVVMTWNILKRHASDIPHPVLANIFICHKQHFCPWVNI